MSTIGIIGFGNFGQFLGKRLTQSGHKVVATSRSDYTKEAFDLGVQFKGTYEDFFSEHPEVVILATSILSLEEVVKSMPLKALEGKLVVDVLSVKSYPKEFLKRLLPNECDILCTHPMFGPDSGKGSWEGLAFVFEKVRIRNQERAENFLNFFEKEGCRMVEMSAEEHDAHAASTQFITHTTGRMLEKLHLRHTPINTKGYEELLKLIEQTVHDSFDLYYGLYEYNTNARLELLRMEQGLLSLKNQLFDRARQERHHIIIGIQGGEGSFNHQAALELVEKYQYTHYELMYLITSENVLEALNNGVIDFGVFAIENSGSGTVLPSIFSMSKYPHEIIEIHNMRLTQCLLKRKETKKEDMKKIITHPQAIKQCRNTLANAYPELTWDYLSDDYDTAECARNLSLGKYEEGTVVIASEIAAIKYGLEVVERGINDDPENFTSFIFCKRR